MSTEGAGVDTRKINELASQILAITAGRETRGLAKSGYGEMVLGGLVRPIAVKYPLGRRLHARRYWDLYLGKDTLCSATSWGKRARSRRGPTPTCSACTWWSCINTGRPKAKVAVARKLLIRLSIMLRDQIDYAEFRARGRQPRVHPRAEGPEPA